MNKVFAFFSVVTIFLFFFLVSVAGENSRTDSIVEEFVISVTNEDFSNECISVVTLNSEDADLDCEQNMFVFAVSLLKRFEFLESDSPYIYLKRENYWIPFIHNEGIRLSLSLSETERTDWFGLSDDIDYVSDLFVIKRNGFRWQIDSITIMEPELAAIYHNMKEQIDFDKYLVKVDSGYQIKDVTINDHLFTEEDRLLLKFSVEKLLSHFASLESQERFVENQK
ncbi:hypothetical protein [Vibrio mexicanus]|uniref:hypothetical protein n=1 Tax=Vibrio mexicanus TaxID=1004326 RepID=UPI00063C4174|nr:hypothetical protein [Vibrio mexicanus]